MKLDMFVTLAAGGSQLASHLKADSISVLCADLWAQRAPGVTGSMLIVAILDGSLTGKNAE